MLSIHTAPQNTAANVSPSNSVDTDAISTDPGSEMKNRRFLRNVLMGTSLTHDWLCHLFFIFTLDRRCVVGLFGCILTLLLFCFDCIITFEG